jgi:23S rRNA pseudouridine2605 synthase
MLERLQKIIARAGIASRRHAEELIKSGLVTVNGQTITELGSKADESSDHIKVQGKLLRPQTERVYLLLNKPPEVVSTMIDPEGRRTLADLLYGVSQRVFPVGRLEYHSMGLVFLTNDGELANLMLKAHQLPQTYHLKLKTLLTFEEIETLSRATGAQINRIKGKEAPWYEVTLSEARRDALRNRLFQTGHPVEKIKRVKIGNLAMESLPTGGQRPLSDAELATLRRLVEPGAAQTAAPVRAPDSRQGHPPTHLIASDPATTGFKPLARPARRGRAQGPATTLPAPKVLGPSRDLDPLRRATRRHTSRTRGRITLSSPRGRAPSARGHLRQRGLSKIRAPQHQVAPISTQNIAARAMRNPAHRGDRASGHPNQELLGVPRKTSGRATRRVQNPARLGNRARSLLSPAPSADPNRNSHRAAPREPNQGRQSAAVRRGISAIAGDTPGRREEARPLAG